MTPDDNITIVRRLVDRFVNALDVDVADEIFAEDCVNHRPPPDAPTGRAEIKRFVADIHAAVPGVRFDIDHLFADGDRVALYLSGSGIHSGAYAGVAPTGRSVTIVAMSIFVMRDGQITDRYNITDLAGLMRQIAE